MRWNLHGIIVEGESNDKGLAESWRRSFASLGRGDPSEYPGDDTSQDPLLRLTLDLVQVNPSPPPGDPDYRQGDLLAYYLRGDDVYVAFPRFGMLHLELDKGTTVGALLPECLSTYGVLEDLIAIALSPHLRRRGLFLIHAFAAALNDRVLLLVGDIGSGKTTTGMALLAAGWRVLSNDSPIIQTGGLVRSYPGVLAAYPDTFARFAATRHLAADVENVRSKLTVPIESIWPGCWLDSGPIGAVCFPSVEQRSAHAVEKLTASQALARLLPHAVEQWDRALIPQHLAVLRELIEAAPAFQVRLGPDVGALPVLLQGLLQGDHS